MKRPRAVVTTVAMLSMSMYALVALIPGWLAHDGDGHGAALVLVPLAIGAIATGLVAFGYTIRRRKDLSWKYIALGLAPFALLVLSLVTSPLRGG